jgi:hypothetical protein
VTCVIEEAFRPGTFAWVVLADPGEPAVVSSFWHRDLEPVPGGTRIRESFTHGPGGSGLRWMITQDPDRAGEIIAGRRRQLRDNIRQTLAGMKAAAEARHSSPASPTAHPARSPGRGAGMAVHRPGMAGCQPCEL